MRRKDIVIRGRLNSTALGRAALVAAAVLFHVSRVLAQEKQSAAVPSAGEPSAHPVRRIVVSVPDRKLALIENGSVAKIYRIAVGAKDSPSPSGSFTIAHRTPQPTYYAPGIVTPPGPENPLGTRWIGLRSEERRVGKECRL